MKYKQELPAEVEKQLDKYIERIKNIQWFKPKEDIKGIEKQVQIALKAFGVEASAEYRKLQTVKDWDAAWGAARDAALGAAWGAARDAALGAALGAAWGAAWGVARGAAWDAAWGAARDAARGAARDAARGAARDAARGAADILALNIGEYKEKYPTGNFLHLISLWEAGLYPCGVIDGKFIIYVPPFEQKFPKID